MANIRAQVYVSGHVQGVAFRYSAIRAAESLGVTGWVKNLWDGRVELVAEGDREELEAFREGIRDGGLNGFIQNEQVEWTEATGEYRGFEIGRW